MSAFAASALRWTPPVHSVAACHQSSFSSVFRMTLPSLIKRLPGSLIHKTPFTRSLVQPSPSSRRLLSSIRRLPASPSTSLCSQPRLAASTTDSIRPPFLTSRRLFATEANMVAPSSTGQDYGNFKQLQSFDLDYAPVKLSKWRSEKTGLTVTLGSHACELDAYFVTLNDADGSSPCCESDVYGVERWGSGDADCLRPTDSLWLLLRVSGHAFFHTWPGR